MKKILAVLLAAMVLLSFSSCSKNELNFYNTMKSMASLDDFSFEGEITADIQKLDPVGTDVSEETQKQLEAIRNYSGKAFEYSGTVDSTNNTLSFHLSSPAADGSAADLDIQAKGQNLYLLKDYVAQYGDVSKLPVETIDGKDYISYDMKNVVEEMFAAAERSIRDVSAFPEDQEGETGVYDEGYFMGFLAARSDIENATDARKQAYEQSMLYDNLSEADAAEFRSGYDAGYAACFDQSAEEREQDEKEVTELLKLKPAMLEKASATYFIKEFKSMALKGTDAAVSDLLDAFSVDLVKKDGDSGYSLHLGNDEIGQAAKSLTEYLDNNQDKMVKMITNYLRSLTDEEWIMLGLNPIDRDQYIAELEQESTGLTSGNAEAKTQTTDTVVASDDMDGLLSAFDLGYDLTVKKTGSASYETGESLSVKTKPAAVEQVGMDLDVTITNSLSVSPLSKQELTSEVGGITAGGASIVLHPAEADITECGVLYGTSSDLSGATKLAGAKQSDGSYSVALTGLEKGTMYYYKAYTVDAGGNLLYFGDVKSFQTAQSADTSTTANGNTSSSTTAAVSADTGSHTSPNTGDASSASLFGVLIVCGLAGFAAAASVRSRSKKHD